MGVWLRANHFLLLENDAVPVPGLLRRCQFTSVKLKDDLVQETFTIVGAQQANISAIVEKKKKELTPGANRPQVGNRKKE